MKKAISRTSLISALAVCLLPQLATADNPGREQQHIQVSSAHEQITEQITFLYYDDLDAPRRFYSEVLGLKPYFEQDWASLYRVAPAAVIGVVKLGREHLTPEMKRDAVMVSIVTDDLEKWYERLKADDRVTFQKNIYDHPAVPIRAFLISDPGGYSIEFLKWRK